MRRDGLNGLSLLVPFLLWCFAAETTIPFHLRSERRSAIADQGLLVLTIVLGSEDAVRAGGVFLARLAQRVAIYIARGFDI